MNWPTHPIERCQRPDFKPPHCPWPDCSKHTIQRGESFPYKKQAHYTRICDGKRVQRFFCHSCKTGFSQQSFSCTYYLKKPTLLPFIAAALNSSSAHRQIARTLMCAPSTVTRLSARLGRHAMLLQALSRNELTGITEPLVFDHFETFAYSQDQPIGVGTLVGSQSWFMYDLNPAPHRIGGRRTPIEVSHSASNLPKREAGAQGLSAHATGHQAG
jgi:transposase-like protein